MTGTAASVTTGLYAALLLARGRTEGLRDLARDIHAPNRSFWAIVPCVPMVVALRLMAVAPAAPGISLAQALVRDLLLFAVSWLGYALLSHRIAGALGLAHRWPGYIAVWNWCNVLENLLVLLGAVPSFLGAPNVLGSAAQLFALGWALWIEWHATRTALGVSALTAIAMVLLDEAIGLFAGGLAQAVGGT